MTPDQARIVWDTFKLVQPKSEAVAAGFYERLFHLDPDARALFKGDMREQGRKLMQMIGTAVGSLDKLDVLLPVVEDLGRRHVKYGVRPEQYATVGVALISTLQAELGARFDRDAQAAWVAAYSVLSKTMLQAATN